MTKLKVLLVGGVLALSTASALADSHEPAEAGHEGHEGHGGGMATGDLPQPMQGMMGAMDAMMQDMPVASSGDADADFLLMMIPHHQSAVNMARVVIEHGDDEETRALAEAIIAAQEAEIAQMRAMLERLGVKAPAAE